MTVETEASVAPAAAAPQNLDAIVAKYIQLRDLKAAKKKAFDADVELIDKGMDKLEAYFLGVMKQQGLKSLPTTSGTPYQSSRTSVTVADPAVYFAWILEDPDRAPFLDIKANKTAVAAFKEEHADLPPGLNWREELVCNVKR